MRVRTRQFALAIISFYSTLPRRKEAQVIGDQLLRSGTSVGAHFREAQRAKSVADFISKMEGGLQELDETAYWLELLKESGLNISKQLDILQSEANQLIAIFVTIVKKTKASSKRTA